MKQKKGTAFLSIVIPAYNEAKRLPATLKDVDKYLRQRDYAYEILVVDDGSTDETVAVVESLRVPHLRIIKNRENRGKGYTVKNGMDKASGKYILFMDADNASTILELEKLLPHLVSRRFEVAIGSRYKSPTFIKKRQPFYRVLLGRGGNWLIQLILLPGINDTQCGFKLFTHQAAKNIFKHQTVERFGFDIEILRIAKALGYRIKEEPVVWRDDPNTNVRFFRDGLRTLRDLALIKGKELSGVYGRIKNEK